jgi:hypothetical protein
MQGLTGHEPGIIGQHECNGRQILVENALIQRDTSKRSHGFDQIGSRLDLRPLGLRMAQHDHPNTRPIVWHVDDADGAWTADGQLSDYGNQSQRVVGPRARERSAKGHIYIELEQFAVLHAVHHGRQAGSRSAW